MTVAGRTRATSQVSTATSDQSAPKNGLALFSGCTVPSMGHLSRDRGWSEDAAGSAGQAAGSDLPSWERAEDVPGNPEFCQSVGGRAAGCGRPRRQSRRAVLGAGVSAARPGHLLGGSRPHLRRGTGSRPRHGANSLRRGRLIVLKPRRRVDDVGNGAGRQPLGCLPCGGVKRHVAAPRESSGHSRRRHCRERSPSLTFVPATADGGSDTRRAS
jgi:hypothetical protein